MRCTRNVRAGIEIAAFVFVLAFAGVADAQARRAPSRRMAPPAAGASEPKPATAPSLRMQDTTITGERQRPDVIFVVPTGKGGKLQSPHLRDYSGEILEPVVKSWLEKDQTIGPIAAQAAPSWKLDWKSLLREEPRKPPPPPPPPAPPPSRPPSIVRPSSPPSPTAATGPFAGEPPSAPAPAAAPPAEVPPSRPPVSPPLAPKPSGLTTAEGVPILVPPE